MQDVFSLHQVLQSQYASQPAVVGLLQPTSTILRPELPWLDACDHCYEFLDQLVTMAYEAWMVGHVLDKPGELGRYICSEARI